MKKSIKILIVTFIIIVILGTVFYAIANKNKEKNISEEEALVIAKEKYNLLLEYAEANNMNLSGNSDNQEGYSFNGEYYLKIDNYDDTIKANIADEDIENFKNIAQIIENNGNYYINVDRVGLKKDSTYSSTQIVLKSITKDEIVCNAESCYIIFDEQGNKQNSKIIQEFKLKKVNKIWKVSEFELPY